MSPSAIASSSKPPAVHPTEHAVIHAAPAAHQPALQAPDIDDTELGLAAVGSPDHASPHHRHLVCSSYCVHHLEADLADQRLQRTSEAKVAVERRRRVRRWRRQQCRRRRCGTDINLDLKPHLPLPPCQPQSLQIHPGAAAAHPEKRREELSREGAAPVLQGQQRRLNYLAVGVGHGC